MGKKLEKSEVCVFFVGIHHKPGKPALCSSTISGKRIDSIIGKLGGYKTVKTNLYPLEHLPKTESDRLTANSWSVINNPKEGDIIVLLGGIVQKDFKRVKGCTHINAAHPSLQFSSKRPSEYFDEIVKKISKATEALTPKE